MMGSETPVDELAKQLEEAQESCYAVQTTLDLLKKDRNEYSTLCGVLARNLDSVYLALENALQALDK